MPFHAHDLLKVCHINYTHFGNYAIIGICCSQTTLNLRGI
jgi:hypothetical protein